MALQKMKHSNMPNSAVHKSFLENIRDCEMGLHLSKDNSIQCFITPC